MPKRERRRYRVYVIKLKRSVWERSARYRAANPQYVPGKPHVYVGSTAKTPEQRFATHMAGGRGSSRLVKRFGKKLFPWAYQHVPAFAKRAAAERAEARKAEDLRGRGWGVWCNAEPLASGLARADDSSLPSELPEEKLERYAATVLEIGELARTEVDLREPLASENAQRIAEVMGAEAFTVITAENPFGVDSSPESNEDSTTELRRSLERSGRRFVPAVGRNPENTHREYSFAVAGELEPILSLAREFRQDAVFRFERARFSLIEAGTGLRHPLPLNSPSRSDASDHVRPAFLALSQLACAENWCWNLACTTCGHMCFRFGLREVARGKHPDDPAWVVSVTNQDKLVSLLGDFTRWRGSLPEQTRLSEAVAAVPLRTLANTSRFPDWLGHLGLVLWHTERAERQSLKLTTSLVPQLLELVATDSPSSDHLQRLLAAEKPLMWTDLEVVEQGLSR